MSESYEVTATALNLRSEPVVAPSSKLAMLPEGQVVLKLSAADDATWWLIETKLNSVTFRGYVKRQYLAAASSTSSANGAVGRAPEVHLTPKSAIRRDQSHGRAYPLNEAHQPRRTEISPESLIRIVDWLDVESHARYLPVPGATYCNIYAYDYCYLAGSFLPRVWWTSGALQRLASGEEVLPLYENTVTELNANSLYNWFGEHGPAFGWRRVAEPSDLQSVANRGGVAVICGKRKDLNRSGHIVAVVPETPGHQAVAADGVVRVPLQSQAGATNFRYGASKRWWLDDKFSAFGFWVRD